MPVLLILSSSLPAVPFLRSLLPGVYSFPIILRM